jgi:hypothetical protein
LAWSRHSLNLLPKLSAVYGLPWVETM